MLSFITFQFCSWIARSRALFFWALPLFLSQEVKGFQWADVISYNAAISACDAWLRDDAFLPLATDLSQLCTTSFEAWFTLIYCISKEVFSTFSCSIVHQIEAGWMIFGILDMIFCLRKDLDSGSWRWLCSVTWSACSCDAASSVTVPAWACVKRLSNGSNSVALEEGSWKRVGLFATYEGFQDTTLNHYHPQKTSRREAQAKRFIFWQRPLKIPDIVMINCFESSLMVKCEVIDLDLRHKEKHGKTNESLDLKNWLWTCWFLYIDLLRTLASPPGPHATSMYRYTLVQTS